MKSNTNSVEFVDSGMRAWYIIHRANSDAEIVFDPSLKVTPRSVFGQDVWRFPEHYAPPGSRVKCTFNFLGKVFVSLACTVSLNADSDHVLVQQLKQCTYYFMYHREIADRSREVSPLSVSTAHNAFLILRRIFCNMKRVGFKSLEDLNSQDAIDKVFSDTGCASISFNDMVRFFSGVYTLCEKGLITSGMPRLSYFIPLRTIIDDNDDEGASAFEIEDVAQVINRSLLYIDNRLEINARVLEIRENKDSISETLAWAKEFIPRPEMVTKRNILNTLSTLSLMSSFNLCGFHLGCRGSELLSSESGFIGHHLGDGVLFTDRMTLRATTYKAIRKLYGDVRYFPVHPYMLDVSDALTGMQNALGLPKGPLFASPHTGNVMTVSHLNERIQFFLKLNDIDAHATSHSWRKTIPGIVVEVMHSAMPDLVELLGHSSEEETSRYAAASPWLHDSIANESRYRLEQITSTLLSQTTVFGGNGLGGGGSVSLETIAREAMINADSGLSNEEIIREEAAELFETGVVPCMVDQNTICFKPQFTQGLCTLSTGNLIADPERCRSECDHRVQLAAARELIISDISSMSEYLTSGKDGKLEKMRWCTELAGRVRGFSDLENMLNDALDENPKISFWFR